MHTPHLVIAAQTKDLGGGFTVRRLLPAAARQAVGPFLFFDHFGPVEAGPGDEHDVRPHPHIGLATVTYLFEGAMQHRDSLGVVQRIEPGAINWMTAGRGIVHSERTPDELRTRQRRSHGLQVWVALPEADEEMAPAFVHTPAAALPELEVGGAHLRLLVGSAFGATSPVAVRSPMLYLDIELAAGDALPLPLAEERAVYVVEGVAALDGAPLPAGRMVVLTPGDEPMLSAEGDARVVLIGGAPLGQRHIWWNFVSSRKERIVQAADDWAAGRFPAVPGETEAIPLPDRRPL
ncbi:MAG: pirin family protein [Rubrivivax sp.]|nr:pirin family protein [Rubrivivax sp.]